MHRYTTAHGIGKNETHNPYKQTTTQPTKNTHPPTLIPITTNRRITRPNGKSTNILNILHKNHTIIRNNPQHPEVRKRHRKRHLSRSRTRISNLTRQLSLIIHRLSLITLKIHSVKKVTTTSLLLRHNYSKTRHRRAKLRRPHHRPHNRRPTVHPNNRSPTHRPSQKRINRIGHLHSTHTHLNVKSRIRIITIPQTRLQRPRPITMKPNYHQVKTTITTNQIKDYRNKPF